MNPTNKSKTIPGGLLIAFEGIDGSGKTTMARRAAQSLSESGFQTACLREPTDGPHGRRLREIMVSPEKRDPELEFELFLLDRQDDVKNNIRPVLDADGIVCIDRYYISSMAYQGALGIDPARIRRENEKFAPIPCLILYFDIPIETALQRIQASRPDGANQFEKREYLEKVKAQFEIMDFSQMETVDARKNPDEVFNEVRERISRLIHKTGQ